MDTQSHAFSVAGGLWRTLLFAWFIVMTSMLGVALAYAQGAPLVVQVFSACTPLLSAVLVFRGVRETVGQKQLSDDHAHWWDQTKWAFDVVISPHAQAPDLEMAYETLMDQLLDAGVPNKDLNVAIRMTKRANDRLVTLGDRPSAT
ncbi:hypothetical protein [Corynebacterium sp.]|uniref:hypothetical protein n=1 Tax=Corynebacterium sp. TaxID=1720 RepID=UPI0028AC9E26|nr:hypothetical protein [Corynebacterium sp.]